MAACKNILYMAANFSIIRVIFVFMKKFKISTKEMTINAYKCPNSYFSNSFEPRSCIINFI